MSEKEKMQKEELEQVAGGSIFEYPEVELTCNKCGKKFKHKDPGRFPNATGKQPVCPHCGHPLGNKVD